MKSPERQLEQARIRAPGKAAPVEVERSPRVPGLARRLPCPVERWQGLGAAGELPGHAEEGGASVGVPVGVQGVLGGLEQGGRSHAAVGELAGELVERRGALGGLAEARQHRSFSYRTAGGSAGSLPLPACQHLVEDRHGSLVVIAHRLARPAR